MKHRSFPNSARRSHRFFQYGAFAVNCQELESHDFVQSAQLFPRISNKNIEKCQLLLTEKPLSHILKTEAGPRISERDLNGRREKEYELLRSAWRTTLRQEANETQRRDASDRVFSAGHFVSFFASFC